MVNQHTNQRRIVINTILNSVTNATANKVGVDKKKLIGTICLDYNLSDRKVKEYIAVLIDSGKIAIREDGLIYSNEPLPKELEMPAL